MAPTRDLAPTPGRSPDWEWNWRPFDAQAGNQSTEPHQLEPIFFFKLEKNFISTVTQLFLLLTLCWHFHTLVALCIIFKSPCEVAILSTPLNEFLRVKQLVSSWKMVVVVVRRKKQVQVYRGSKWHTAQAGG